MTVEISPTLMRWLKKDKLQNAKNIEEKQRPIAIFRRLPYIIIKNVETACSVWKEI